MGTEKSRERFSIKFNEGDPAHKAVIDVLEQQGPRRKAQFIVNAVLHYIHCSETPDITAMPKVDKEYIESVIREILSREKIDNGQIPEQIAGSPLEHEVSPTMEIKKQNDSETRIADDSTLALIVATMSAFRNT